MDVKICEKRIVSEKAMGMDFVETLNKLAETNHDIVALDADLQLALGFYPMFGLEYKVPLIDCGIQEANMIGVAAGMSIRGKIPFAHSFSPFVTRRAFDQIYISGAYAKLNLKVIGSDPGIYAKLNGGTHMPFEDMGIICTIPEVTAIDVTDNTMLEDLLPQIAAQYGVSYTRIVLSPVKNVYAEGSHFEIGKAQLLRDGKDATIIASGYCVSEALDAAELLVKQGVSVRVLDMFTWKPVDKDAIFSAAKDTGLIVTAENHNVNGGLGSIVAKVLVENCPTRMRMVGVQDQFGEVGQLDYLSERFELNAKDIAAAVMDGLK